MDTIKALLLLFAISVLLCDIMIRRMYSLTEKKKEEAGTAFNNLEYLLQDNVHDKIYALIDSLIDDALDNYQILELSKNEAQYINEQESTKMEAYINQSLEKNMSEDMIRLIGLIYDIQYPGEEMDIVRVRIKLKLINFISEYNDLIQ